MKKQTFWSVAGIIALVALFLLASYFVQKYIIFFENLFDHAVLGMIIFALVMMLETIFAPISVLPLIPIGSNLWGPIPTALILIAGWTTGSIIAFAIARYYGRPLVKKIISVKKMEKAEAMIPERNIFWGIVILRIMIPVDVLSYVLGIFSRIKWKTYSLATLIGIAPGAFILAYLGKLPFLYQLNAVMIGAIAIMIIVIISFLKHKDPRLSLKKSWNKIFK